MLNISVAPQIKSSAENPVAMINSGSTGAKEPVAEEFGKVLEREVSETKDKRETGNTSNSKEHSDSAASSEESVKGTDKDMDTATDKTVAATKDDANNFIQNLLSNMGSTYKTDPALSAIVSALNPEATSTVPPTMTLSSQNALIPLDGEQIAGSTIPISNQLLQQKLAQLNLGTSGSTVLPDDMRQSLGTADSAAYGKFLPFSSEMNEAIQVNSLGESIFSTHGESISPQSFSLSNSASATSLNAALQDIHVDLPVGQPKWGGEFAQKIVWLTSQQQQVAEIHLNPAHLGPVDVMLSITQDQATAQFSSPHLAVREAIEQALPKLREMLAENGIQLGNVTVGADSFQQDSRQQQAYHSEKDTTHMTDARPETAGPIETTVVPSRHLGMVNTYA